MLFLAFPILAALAFAAHILYNLGGITEPQLQILSFTATPADLVKPLILVWLHCTLIPMFLKKPFSCHLVQVLLVLSSIEWIRTAASLAMARSAAGMPWIRATLIILAVAAFAAFSAALMSRVKRLRAWYRLDEGK